MTSRRLLGRVGDDGLEVGVRHAPAVEGPGALQHSSGMAAQEVVRLKSFLLRAVEVFTIIPYTLLGP